MKKSIVLILALALSLAALTACAGDPAPDFSSVSFADSPYKHVNNGGVTDDATLPYNIDAITGATLTVEGPSVVTSIPLSVRELENRNEGLCRGLYEDDGGRRIYEGLDLYYLLHDMVEGDNGIRLTPSAYKVVIKNSSRAEIASFTLGEIAAAHESGAPILLAYGMATADEKLVAPFVFDAAREGEHSLGYVEKLGNDDGCIRLVYDRAALPGHPCDTFANAAYVYVCEETEPGFKHSGSARAGYAASRYTDYILCFRGAGLGCELDLTVGQLEALVTYDASGAVEPGGMGCADSYSLANTTYWYVNRYEGLDLYKLLQYLGMASAEEMGLKAARTTLVHFVAADGVPSNESFSVDTLSYPDAFGFYNKNAADMGDGGYVPTNADLVKSGYPVLLAYGVNNYPYTIGKTDAEYLSGLSNSGGPMRVVFGKTQYNHANGSNQVQYLSDVIVGDDVLYNTHEYTDNAAQHALAADTLAVSVTGADGAALLERELRVGEIEELIYGADVAGNVKRAARIKDHYELAEDGAYTADIFEGVDLEYLLMERLGLPGTNGTITFANGTDSLTLTLDELFAEGYNSALGRAGLRSVLAFARNGAPMVADENAAGYVDAVALRPYLASDPAVYEVGNGGGPLCAIIPSTSAAASDARCVTNVTSIHVELVPDSYAHIEGAAAALATDTVRFYGAGLEAERVYTVGELEGKQTRARTLDFSFLDQKGRSFEERYRGLALYELFTEIGIKNNAGDVTVYAADGTSQTFSLSRLKKAYANALSPEKEALSALLAYGTGALDATLADGFPLVADEGDPGYDAARGNDGGPLQLIVPQESATDENRALCVKNVVAVEVGANDVDTWSHAMSDVYGEFLDDSFTLTIKNDAHEWTYDFTVAQLESLKDILVRDTYSVLDVGECEGVDIWKLLMKFAAAVPGMDEPVSITAYAADGYKNDLLSVFYKEGFELGVADESGARRKLILCYAINGCPLVDSESHEGYTGLAGNGAGPLRVIAETNQGASVKYCTKLVVTLPGNAPLDITVDDASFGRG